MTQEQKAIETIKQMIADGQISQEVAEKYFPELADSEDERIRKWCISHFRECFRVTSDNVKYQEYLNNKVIPWLEKQGNQKPFEWSEEDEIRIEYLSGLCWVDKNIRPEFAEDALDWLESLRPQKQRKPSEEELEALEKVCAGKDFDVIALYGLLKKMKEL